MNGYYKAGDVIKRTIDAMEPAMRSVVIGYFYNNLSVEDLAGAMNLEASEVYKLMNRGRKVLKEAILIHRGQNAEVNDHKYLHTEIYLSCAEEAVETAIHLL